MLPADLPRRPLSDPELHRRYARTRHPQLREALVGRYLPLAKAIAQRHHLGNEPLDDLLQVACIGLLKAIDRFEPEHGAAFSSFAVPTIAGEVRRHFRDRCWAIKPPRSVQEQAVAVSRARQELTVKFGRSPTVRELGQALSFSDEEVLDGLMARRAEQPTSLSAPLGQHVEEGERLTLESTLGQEDGDLDAAERRTLIEQLTAELPRRQREALHLRVFEDLTQAEISRRLGVSQMQVSRLLREATARVGDAASAPPAGIL